MAHQIAGRPDFDQLLEVQIPDGFLTEDELAAGVEVTFPDQPPTEPLAAGQTAKALRPGAAVPLPVSILTEHYLESGDLSF